MTRVLIVGLDGATFDLLNPLIDGGRLPNLKRLYQEGTTAVLESTPFPHSGPAWASCLTGVNPGKHGIFGFGVRDEKNNYRLGLVNSTSLCAKTLPLLLTEHGKCTGLINEPLSYPPYPIHGFMVSGLMTPLTASRYTFPPELREELLQAVPGYITEVSTDRFNLKENQGKAAYAEALFTSIRVRTKASKILMKQKAWDVLMVVFTEVDRLQHSFWGHLNNPSSPDQRADQSLDSIVSRTYEEIDAALGSLLEDLPEKTRIIVVSDHGFGPSERPFYTNRFLEEHGYLKFRIVRGFPSLRSPQTAMKRILQIMGLSGVFRRKRQAMIPDSRGIRDPKNFQRVVERWVPEDMVNWKRTKAFADQHGIRINMKGREPKGIVAPGSEAEWLIEELRNLLIQLKCPYNGKKVFTDVQRKEAVYVGPHVDKAPDLITFMEAGTPHPSYRAREVFGALQSTTGAHRKEGIFLAWGEGIRKGKRLERASIMDVTPTVCYSLGIPRTIEMDGAVLDIFDGGLDPKRLSERSGTSVREIGNTLSFSLAETSEIEAKLRGLGYLE